MKFLATFFLFVTVLVSAQSPEEWFQRGNLAYAEGNYEEAISAYESALDRAHSAALHNNLGNAYAQLGRAGPAVLHYERALAMEPGKAEAVFGLQRMRDRAGLTEPERSLLWGLAQHFHVDTWAWFSAFVFWLGGALIALPYLVPNLGKSLPFTVAVICLLAFSTGVLGLLGYHGRGHEGVILTAEATLRVAPASQSPAAGEVREGLTAQYVDQRNGFYLVRLPDGQSGWLKASEYQPIWELVPGSAQSS